MKNKKLFWIISANILLITLIILFSTVGSVNLGFGEIIHELLTGDNQMVRTIVLKMRLPRNLLAVLVGSNLAVAGLFLQAVMKNGLVVRQE